MKWEQIAEAKRILERETSTIFKDWGGKLAVALIYPNTYFVGMSSLGLQTLYRLFNARADVVCERVFYPGPGIKDRGLEVISLESQRPLTDFGILAFTLSYEMDYFHVVEMLRQAGIPPLAAQRDTTWPLVIAGGPAISANPEPLAPFFDAIVIGEGEGIIGPLVEACQETRGTRGDAGGVGGDPWSLRTRKVRSSKLEARKVLEGFSVRRSKFGVQRRTPNPEPETCNLEPETDQAAVGA